MFKFKFNTKTLAYLALLTALLMVFSFTPIGTIPIGPLSITLNIIPVAIAAIALGPIGGLIIGSIFGLLSYLQCFSIGVPSTMGIVLVGIDPILAFIQRFVPRALDGFLVGVIYYLLDKKFENKKSVSASTALFGSIAGGIIAILGAAVGWTGISWIGADKKLPADATEATVKAAVGKANNSTLYIVLGGVMLLAGIGLVIYFIVKKRTAERTEVKPACFIAGFLSAILNTLFFMTALVVLFGNTEYVQGLMAGRNIFVFIIAFVGVNALVEIILSTYFSGVIGSALYRAKLLPITEKENKKRRHKNK